MLRLLVMPAQQMVMYARYPEFDLSVIDCCRMMTSKAGLFLVGAMITAYISAGSWTIWLPNISSETAQCLLGEVAS